MPTNTKVSNRCKEHGILAPFECLLSNEPSLIEEIHMKLQVPSRRRMGYLSHPWGIHPIGHDPLLAPSWATIRTRNECPY